VYYFVFVIVVFIAVCTDCVPLILYWNKSRWKKWDTFII